ncbi:S8 family peptidase [Cohnella silvisoli]|uniref:S8 family peptidase n=1 Tax=Cohnella silvisoli TaxID=2873699 RepID=A0ABV1KYG0_9BACL|nr:S8 family peptidase [Cohnella silvisoli]MCD9024471.1 S8 family peptidase [Cohnella silvisoli]
MRRNKLLGFLFTFALVLFAIPLASPALRPWHPAPSRVPNVQSAAKKEVMYKQQTVQRDMEATERLSRSQVARDVHHLLLKEPANGKSGSSVEALLKTHPEILYAEWTRGNQHKKVGSIDKGLDKAAKPYLSKAHSSLRQGTPYSSPTFSYNGKSYFVLSQKAANSKQSLVALVSTEVIQAVERHQRRNLRLIPYPPEGRYRIESVTPGSNKETTVRTGEDNGNASHYTIDEIVAKFRTPLTEKQLLQLRKELDLSVIKHTGKTYVFRSKKHQTHELKAYFLSKWKPEYVEPHYLYLTNGLQGSTNSVPFVPNDTLYSEYQWNLPEIATENGWNVTKGSKDVIVAVVDTGVQSDHPDLKGRLVKGTNIVDPSSPPDDDVGHGTHVAGIIAAEVNNNEGVAGMTWFTKIMPVKVLDSSGAGSTYSVAEGIIWATDHGAHIINMSLGNYAEAEFLHDALKYAYDHGVVLVAASGNDNTDRPGYPAAYPEVLAISATDQSEARAEYSNYGDYIDVAAPGTSIPSTYPGSRYAALSGTSMASPHVAALASLVRAANSKLTNVEIMELLRRTARDLGKPGKDNDYGYGQIDVMSALQSASGTNTSLQLFPQQVRRELEQLNKK